MSAFDKLLEQIDEFKEKKSVFGFFSPSKDDKYESYRK